jgi:4a-hydroxytetrahydrobiopterin dehydratase
VRGTATICLGGEYLENLSDMECIPCKGGVPPLSEEESGAFLSQIHEDWEVVENHHLTRTWSFPDFASALEFTNQLGEVCEQQNHHADFELGWGRVVSVIFTHKIDGLTESDFVLASKFDTIQR